ncbi:class III lanthionine synthetase LanKC [Nonomuraea sp. NPDC050663]|uniref:class III lanthionine synthetase LanKC n=1 Tax=Nonomuraea sp. NPDC050663 TaxID=3364370 RepID=UPI0037B2D296
MTDQYELYCLADAHFYDVPRGDVEEAVFAAARRPLPEGWNRFETDTWVYFAPESGRPLPPQGWKIHVSARADDAEQALAAVWEYCVTRGVAFKFLRGLPVLVMLGSKAASRASSGKLVTIYPADDAQLELVLKDLDELLRGIRGPYILSDLRYGDGPLYVRYGGFAERHCLSDSGARVLAVEDGEGRLVPDVRQAVFTVPPWTTLPAFLAPHLEARNSVTMEGLPYTIEQVLHFSNGGGVYLGRDGRTGRQVVLKEARPHAGLDAAGRDAVARLAHERDILERLAGLPVVPELIDHFTVGEHGFLVMEFVDGVTLQRRLVRRFPLTWATCTEAERADYAAWAMEVSGQVEAAVAMLHERGVVFGDLHPDNVLLTEDGRVVLIDYEVATLESDGARAALAHPAYVAPQGHEGADVDRYAMACLRLGLFAPQCTIMQPLHRGKAAHLGQIVSDVFPGARVESDVAIIAGEHPWQPPALPGQDPWPQVREALQRAIAASATPGRDDRLFPGDIAQFQPGRGLSLANGAAGVFYAQLRAGCRPDHQEWLLDRARAPKPGWSLGLYDGLYGVAYVLDLLGHRGEALDLLGICLKEKWERLESALFSGLSGIGLVLYHFGQDDAASRAVELCAERLGGPGDVPETSGGGKPRAGLMYGSAGPALLFLHAYERTGERHLLDLAATALRQDLRRCKAADDGSLQVNQGWRLLPYLDEGSAGIALVLERYLAHRHDDELATALERLRLVARSGYFVQPGLFTGRAGIIAAFGAGEAGLRWHALPYAGGLAFPGDQLLRLSMDLATGTAGVLLALASLHAAPRAGLPFLDHGKEVSNDGSPRPAGP